MNQFTITHLDRRHRGHSLFSHYITAIWTSQLEDRLKFFEWRNWCWQTWGPGWERDLAIEFVSNTYTVARWAWHTDDRPRKLYFHTERELNWFVLTWSS